eukprot:CAMPEP_0185588042 /NCGR_PEP_ID=MMETSP0434-20130131/51648_1 /TAXON_ID=626734 ORGANISM="Favella taraikaensis, Strain Fe Narragansett Bay" /NCGR_SAMPLE_ID=MMETSP0434 /ASSEMBLY_ACC=CAM_ASM_000379 /LENGTH=146 /DNA_ID=CAMNT_0028210425 /DNA_START=2125 /DNA_END=2565 /DNA_ORIENTATION=-
MLIKFVFRSKQYAMLHQLLQFYVLNDSLELARVLVSLGSCGNQNKNAHYEPAVPAGVGHVAAFEAVLGDRGGADQRRPGDESPGLRPGAQRALDEAELDLGERGAGGAAGHDEKATMIVKRLQRLKKYDEARLQNNNGYKPLLVDE